MDNKAIVFSKKPKKEAYQTFKTTNLRKGIFISLRSCKDKLQMKTIQAIRARKRQYITVESHHRIPTVYQIEMSNIKILIWKAK